MQHIVFLTILLIEETIFDCFCAKGINLKAKVQHIELLRLN